jgi:hypothetical protein
MGGGARIWQRAGGQAGIGHGERAGTGLASSEKIGLASSEKLCERLCGNLGRDAICEGWGSAEVCGDVAWLGARAGTRAGCVPRVPLRRCWQLLV